MEQEKKGNGIIVFLVLLALVFASLGSWQTVENQQNKATIETQSATIADLQTQNDSLVIMSSEFSQHSQNVITDFQTAVEDFVQKLEKYKATGDSLQINITTTSGKPPVLNVQNTEDQTKQ